MNAAIQRLIDEYLRWLRAEMSLAQVGNAFEITTPFLDRHNDQIQIYVKQEQGRLILSDDGCVMSDLKNSGCSLDSPRRQVMLKSILNGFGVRTQGDELTVVAHNGDFPQRKHALIQAMLAVGDLFATAKPNVQNLFLEDVAGFLDSIQARFLPNVQLMGKSGFQHKFDFAIPKSSNAPERLVRAINRPTRETAGAVIFAWTDTRAVRQDTATMYAVLNDSESRVHGDVVDAMRQYDIVPVIWSERQKFSDRLAA